MRANIQLEVPKTANTLILPIALSDGEIPSSLLAQAQQWTKVPVKHLEQSFAGKKGETFPIWENGCCYLLLGLGEKPDFNQIQVVFRQFAQKHKTYLSGTIAIDGINKQVQENTPLWTEAIVNGLIQGTYQIGQYKTDETQQHPLLEADTQVSIVSAETQKAASEQAIQRALIIGKAQKQIMDLVNAPNNYKTPEHLSDWAEKSAKDHGFSVNIWNKEKIEKAGMEALLAVNRGSEHPATFIIMEYKGADPGHHPKIALVGKGVTFDTGGLSLKPSTNMHYMKSDMGGAAAVFGTMEAVAQLKLPIHLIGVVPVTDNSIGTLAIKPSDVIGSYSGKTIEIIDTDAEGRLILADGLSYVVKEHQPNIVIDLATLTGSSVRTFGYHAAALFSNNDQLATRLFEAGMKSGERVWQLPIWDEYAEEMKSDVADIKNFSGRPTSGAITAAKFLEFFTDKHPSWAHLDIAGVAFGDGDYGKGKTAKGYGIRLLVTFLESILP